MGQDNFDNIACLDLVRISTSGGDVLRGLKCDDIGFVGFGEAYFSWIEFGAVKAWKRHQRMTMNVIVPVGAVKFVFIEIEDGILARKKEQVIGTDNYTRLVVPPGVWFGFKGMAKFPSLILNVANIPHDPHEVDHMSTEDVDYSWES